MTENTPAENPAGSFERLTGQPQEVPIYLEQEDGKKELWGETERLDVDENGHVVALIGRKLPPLVHNPYGDGYIPL